MTTTITATTQLPAELCLLTVLPRVASIPQETPENCHFTGFSRQPIGQVPCIIRPAGTGVPAATQRPWLAQALRCFFHLPSCYDLPAAVSFIPAAHCDRWSVGRDGDARRAPLDICRASLRMRNQNSASNTGTTTPATSTPLTSRWLRV